MKKLLAQLNDYALGVWFEVIRYDVDEMTITVIDHLMGKLTVFRIDESVKFKVTEETP